MKEVIYANEIKQENLEKYQVQCADYLEYLFGLNDIEEINPNDLITAYESEIDGAGDSFRENFHKEINNAVVLRFEDKGFVVEDAVKNDLSDAFFSCRGIKKEIYVEDNELYFNSSRTGERMIRLVRDDITLEKKDYIPLDKLDEYTEPAADLVIEKEEPELDGEER